MATTNPSDTATQQAAAHTGAPTYSELYEAVRCFTNQSIGSDWTAEQAMAFVKEEGRALLSRFLRAQGAGLLTPQAGQEASPQDPEAYNHWVRSREREAVVRRLQADTYIQTEAGKPFASEASAREYALQWDLGGTHDPVVCPGGWCLWRLPLVAQAERCRAASGIETYSQAQAAVAAEMGIGENADGEWDLDDAGFVAMERRVQARIRDQKASALGVSSRPAVIAESRDKAEVEDAAREQRPSPRG